MLMKHEPMEVRRLQGYADEAGADGGFIVIEADTGIR